MRLNRLNLLNKYSAGALPWTDYWISQGLFLELWDLRRKNASGNADGLINSDLLTISGTLGSEIYQCPNTAPYIAADTDFLWFTSVPVRRDVTTDELRGYDFPKTIVRYMGLDPFTLEAIGILNLSAVITEELLIKLSNDFKLNPWWSGDWIDAGEVKENRPFEQTLWTP